MMKNRLLDSRLPTFVGRSNLNALTAFKKFSFPCNHTFSRARPQQTLAHDEIVSKRLNPTLHLSGVVLCMYESATR